MNFTHTIFVLLVSVNISLFASQAPERALETPGKALLKKSGPLVIPAIASKEEPNSLESRSAFSSHPSSTSSSSSPSPSRRSQEVEQIMEEVNNAAQKTILARLQIANDPRSKDFMNQLRTQLEKKLKELAADVTKAQEEREARENLYYDFPGSSSKVCSLEELAAERAAIAKSAALHQYLCDCP